MADPLATDLVSLAALLTQFGAAGLMGWMWLAERRSAQTRDTQIAELHTRLLQERLQFDSLASIARDCAKAVAAIEVGQRTIAERLTQLLGELSPAHQRADPAAGAPITQQLRTNPSTFP